MQLINSFLANLFARVQILHEDAREEGQTLVEYALIIALVSIVLVAALGTLSGGIEGVFNDITGKLNSA